jgi:hypothetical protein
MKIADALLVISHKYTIIDACEKFNECIDEMKGKYDIKTLLDVLYDFPYTETNMGLEPVSKIKRVTKTISSRVYIVENITGKFVYKYDEQYFTNELSFITICLLKYFGLHCPKTSLVKVPYFIRNNKINDTTRVAQIIEYLPKYSDANFDLIEEISHFHDKFAAIVAFDLFVANGDRFLFLFRYIDNLTYEDYQEIDLWDDPIDNKGNFSFIDDKIWTIDARCSNDTKIIKILHEFVPRHYKEIAELVREYINKETLREVWGTDDLKQFETSLEKYFEKYLTHADLLLKLMEYAQK